MRLVIGAWGLSFLVEAIALGAPAAAQPRAAALTSPTVPPSTNLVGAPGPAFVFRPDKGFIDDPLAIDSSGTRLATLTTDSASFANVEIVDLETGRTVQVMSAGDPQLLFERVLFAGEGGGVIVIVRNPATGRRSAQYFGRDGKPLGLLGPVSDFGLALRGGKTYLIAWDKRTSASGGATFVVSQHEPNGLKRVGKPHGYALTKAGELANPEFRLVSWQDGYSQMLGERPGAYDAKKDFRQPDKAAVFDALLGKLVDESEIKDVYAWALAKNLQRSRPNRALHAVVTDAADAVHLIDAAGGRTPLTLSAPFSHYDPRSLREQEDAAAGILYFSFTVDPLNPDALARLKADKPFLDVYLAASPAARPAPTDAPAQAVRLLRAALDDRPVVWVACSRFAAVLRKHKSFSRGGTELEVYRLDPK